MTLSRRSGRRIRMALTRMIFAIQTTDTRPTRLRVSGDVGTPAPVMTCLRRGDSEPSSVGCVDRSWTMDLDAGDYLVEIQVENWVPGRLDIVTELAPGQSPPTFVSPGALPRSPSPGGLAVWAAPVLTVDDSKDPWPPPPPQLTVPTVTLAQVSSEWFTAELAAARTRIEVQPAGKHIPASVLDALVTGL
jgi:hypothetical protein